MAAKSAKVESRTSLKNCHKTFWRLSEGVENCPIYADVTYGHKIWL